MASVPTTGRNLTNSMTRPMLTFRNTVLALKPAKAEPLLPPAELYAYSISEKPCAPPLFRLSITEGTKAAMPLPTRIPIGVARQTSTAHFISNGSIFFPRNSGVLPTISPAINTVRMANASIPYRPQPVPPKITSPSCISSMVIIPPSGV